MARRCGPNNVPCGMSQGIYNPFFQNGNYWYGSGGVPANAAYVYDSVTGLRIEPNRIYNAADDTIIEFALIYEL